MLPPVVWHGSARNSNTVEHNVKKWLITVSDELDAAAREAASPGPLAHLVREAIAGNLKRPELANQTKMGRPKRIQLSTSKETK